MPLQNFARTLTWPDFTPQSGELMLGNEWAQIHPDITFSDFQLGRVRNGVAITDVTVNIRLIAEDCWVIDSHRNAALLRHEQVHYDIIAISARQFYNALVGLSARNTDALQRRVTQLHTRLAEQARVVDERYDTLTNHGINTSVQQAWETSVAAAKTNAHGTLANLP